MSQTTKPRSTGEGQEPLTRIHPRIILLALGMFALGTDAFIVAGVLPVIAHEAGMTEGLVGQLITVFALTYGRLFRTFRAQPFRGFCEKQALDHIESISTANAAHSRA